MFFWCVLQRAETEELKSGSGGVRVRDAKQFSRSSFVLPRKVCTLENISETLIVENILQGLQDPLLPNLLVTYGNITSTRFQQAEHLFAVPCCPLRLDHPEFVCQSGYICWIMSNHFFFLSFDTPHLKSSAIKWDTFSLGGHVSRGHDCIFPETQLNIYIYALRIYMCTHIYHIYIICVYMYIYIFTYTLYTHNI